MNEGIERKRKIASLFADSVQDQQSNHVNKSISGNHNALGNGNIVINGNIILTSDTTNAPEYITQQQAYEIQQLIYKIADLDAACGYSPSGIQSARKKWWNILRTHFKTTTYKAIPYQDYDTAAAFLQRHQTKLQIEIDQATNQAWRNKYYTAIYARCNERGITKQKLYQMADHYLDASITSLRQLSDNDLKTINNIVLALL